MDRRTFVGAVASGFVIVSRAARAQQAGKVRRIGYLSPGDRPSDAELQQQWAPLRDLGWVEGKNLVVERRYGGIGGMGRLPRLAEELVQLKPELIMTNGTDATLAAKEATTSIPIVMAAGDPVGAGLVASLAHPGGNVTGYSVLTSELFAKRAALLRDVLPGVRRIAVLLNPNARVAVTQRTEIAAVYGPLGIDAIFLDVTSADGFVNGIAEAVRRGAQALEFNGSNTFMSTPDAMRIVTRARLPVLTSDENLLDEGALIFLENNLEDSARRIAAVVDKVLRGAKPRDLPVEQPTKFRLIVNLKAAKALGLTVPRSLILRADEVIQ